MKAKFRLQDIETTGFYFTGYEGLYWHSGKFWLNEQPAQMVNNNGSLSVLYYGSKKSVKQLRKIARQCKIKLLKESLPF